MLKYVHFQQFEANLLGRDFVLGDLHGCYKALHAAMELVEFDVSKDRIFSVGDLIDRGEHSVRCLSLLKESWFFAVQGNHENMMISALRAGRNTPPWEGWIENGGDWYLDLDETERDELKEYLPLVTNLPVVGRIATREGRQVGFCHAEPPILDWTDLIDGKKLTGDEIWRALWGRNVVRMRKNHQIKGVDITFHGHTIIPKVRAQGNMRFIDTGAYLFDSLSLIEINEQLFA